MVLKWIVLTNIFLIGLVCPTGTSVADGSDSSSTEILTGASDTTAYFSILRGKKVGCVVNQTSTAYEEHLVDLLLINGIDVIRVFAPEHGFRGNADAGAHVVDEVDKRSGLPVISLYGAKKKPASTEIQDLDIMLFDIQDVGARFYTYLSTLHYVMEACAEHNVPVLVLDRPNPNAHIVDGPTLDPKYASFVGLHPVPMLYGMTIGEYAQMINGEAWLKNGISADLQVVMCRNYHRDSMYVLPIPPSPNLPNQLSILLYPSLCLLEGTAVSVGRGTNKQFQLYGHPKFWEYSFVFKPAPGPGSADPKLNGKDCYGRDLSQLGPLSIFKAARLDLSYLLETYALSKDRFDYFTAADFFDKLAGSDVLRRQLISGNSEAEIRASWEKDLSQFKTVRKKYLLYD